MLANFFRGCCLALVSVLSVVGLWVSLGSAPALAGLNLTGLNLSSAPVLAELNDDIYDGNIFALYAGNGSIVPPRYSLAQSFKQDKPTLLFFYVDDSRDSKRFASVVSQLQAPYGRAANFIAIAADSIPVKDSYAKDEVGYYFEGVVPQTVIFDADNNLVFSEAGQVPYEKIDDLLREVFDLLPRTESVELKRRPINEVNTELVPD